MPVKFGTLVIVQYNDPNGSCPPWRDFVDMYPEISQDPLDISGYQRTGPAGNDVAEARDVSATVTGERSMPSERTPVPVGPGSSNGIPMIRISQSLASTSGYTTSGPSSTPQREGIPDARSNRPAVLNPAWSLCACAACSKACAAPGLKSTRVAEAAAYPKRDCMKWGCRACQATFTSLSSMWYHRVYVHGHREENTQPLVASDPGMFPESQLTNPVRRPISDLARRILEGNANLTAQLGAQFAPQASSESRPV